MRRLLIAILAVGTAATSAATQTITGIIDATDTRTPIPGVLITVRDSMRHVRGRVLTDQHGAFHFNVAPGRYQLSAEHIGFAPVTRAVDVATGTPSSIRISLATAAIELGGIEVQGARKCGKATEASTAKLWYLARTALGSSATDTEKQFRVREFGRDLNRDLVKEGIEKMQFSTQRGQDTYRAVPIDSLLRYGFVQPRGGMVEYYGPDAQMLLSDEFVDAHCFGVTRNKDKPGLVGLEFRPQADKVAGIQGVLWLNERTGLLQFVEYEFTQQKADNMRYMGGYVEFERLSDGSWIVRRWHHLMPRFVTAPGQTMVRVVGAAQKGGEVLGVSTGDVWKDPVGRIRGVAYDSMTKSALPHAMISLAGTALQTTADEEGAFRFENVPVGDHYVTFYEQRMTGLPDFEHWQRVRVAADSTTTVTVAIPGEQSILALHCERADAVERAVLGGRRRTHGMITGNVHRSGAPVAGARVEFKTLGGTTWVETDAEGIYTLCNYAAQGSAQAIIKLDGKEVYRRLIEPARTSVRRVDFDLAADPPLTEPSRPRR